MFRSFSYSEASTALDCWARHAFSYTGHLSGGDALHTKATAPILSQGRAWGAACAAWHAAGIGDAYIALDQSLDEDAQRQQEFGFYVRDEHLAMRQQLLDLLEDYVASSDRLEGLTRIEHELEVPIPSRHGQRASTRYRFLCKIDGWWLDEFDQAWLYESKLRGTLQDAWLIQLSRQMRWYSWAWAQQSGIKPVGVLVDERWNELPRSPSIVNAQRKGEGIDGRAPSRDKRQLIREHDYLTVCGEYGVEPSPELIERCRSIRWQQRVPILFRQDELEETGKELVTAAKLIRDLDSGELYPLRNSNPRNCRGCRYREICPAPDSELVDLLFERVPPKRERHAENAR